MHGTHMHAYIQELCFIVHTRWEFLGFSVNLPSFIYLLTRIAMILLTGGTFFPLSSGARLTSHLGDLSWYQAVIASIAK